VPYADKSSPENQEKIKAAKRRHYAENSQPYKDRARDRQNRMKQISRDARKRPCFDCGVEYPWYVMEFDHRPGEVKVGEVTKMAKDAVAELRILAEIAKCDVVCSNCHKTRTYIRSLG
jgi:hypothetical protein